MPCGSRCWRRLPGFAARCRVHRASVQAQGWLAPILLRQPGHLRIAHVGRIGDDHVVALVSEARRHPTDCPHTVADGVSRDVDRSDGERVLGNVRASTWPRAARARWRSRCIPTPCRYRARAGPRRLDPWLETRFDQLGDRRARHEHALIDVELMTREPHAAREICAGIRSRIRRSNSASDGFALGGARTAGVHSAASSCRSPRRRTRARPLRRTRCPCRDRTTAPPARTARAVADQLLDRRRLRCRRA